MEAQLRSSHRWVTTGPGRALLILLVALLPLLGAAGGQTEAPAVGHSSHGPSSEHSKEHGASSPEKLLRAGVNPRYTQCYLHAHPHEGLVFLFTALSFGTLILFMTMLPIFHGVQQTVVIYAMGMVYALLGEYYTLYENTGMFGRSYCVWMNIDPHLLIYALLPALLTGDAMAIDTLVARRVYRQCIYLAGPGVLFCSGITALFLWWYIPYNWSFLLCLTVGSILAATDPVAVVSLLKDLGASPTLTVQIQGESLLNDGTAIVLYSVAYKMLEGQDFGTNDVMVFLLRVVLCAIVFGLVIGLGCCAWIRASCRRLDHHSCFVQISITLLCAYWSFILAEELKMSGVLATVTSALVLADRMWPYIVSKESMNNAWHMFEFMGNTVIFFLAGALTGKVMVYIDKRDYFHLFVIYIAVTIVRGSMLLLSRPVFRFFGKDLQPSLGDTAVMCWGGLRGAVGLSLAIHLNVDRASMKLTAMEGKRVLFFTGGIAALTLLVNATTCPLLVKWLGVASTSKTRLKMMKAVHTQLVQLSKAESQDLVSRRLAVQEGNAELTEVSDLAALVSIIMDGMLKNVEGHITNKESKPDLCCLSWLHRDEEPVTQSTSVAEESGGSGLAWVLTHSAWSQNSQASVLTPDEGVKLIMKHQTAWATYVNLPKDMLCLLRFPQVDNDGTHEKLYQLAINGECTRSMTRVVNEAFLSLLRAEYWSQNAKGEFTDDQTMRSRLLDSVGFGLEMASTMLADLSFIVKSIMRDGDLTAAEVGYELEPDVHHGLATPATVDKNICVKLDNTYLSGIMMVVIVANIITIALESSHPPDQTYRHEIYINLCFAIVYLIEFAIKFGAQKCKYFCSSWNLFDFLLLHCGIAGIVVEFLMLSGQLNQAQSVRIARIAKVFRALRTLRIAMRVVTGIKWTQVSRADISKGTGYVSSFFSKAWSRDMTSLQVRYIGILHCFVRAHLKCQQQFIHYFGKKGQVHSTEAGLCLLASQMEVYAATAMACALAAQVERSALVALYVIRESNRIAEDLLHFVDGSHESGILGSREAEALEYPLKAFMGKINSKLAIAVQGQSGHEMLECSNCKEPVGTAGWLKKWLLADQAASLRAVFANRAMSGLEGGQGTSYWGRRPSCASIPEDQIPPAKHDEDTAAVKVSRVPSKEVVPVLLRHCPLPPSPPPSLPGSPAVSPRDSSPKARKDVTINLGLEAWPDASHFQENAS